VLSGLDPVAPNDKGDFIEKPGTEAFDAVHTYAVVRQVLVMYQRALPGQHVDWQWNQGVEEKDALPITVQPHAMALDNAFYARELKGLFFGFSINKYWMGVTHFCRSLDAVAHEVGHAILDGLQPGWFMPSRSVQTGALHESFGDLTAIFLGLSQLDQVDAVIAQTKGDLHDENFISDIGEQIGLQLLNRKDGLRCADNNFKMSQVEQEVHALSEVFTGAIYKILADTLEFRRDPRHKDDAAVLLEFAQKLHGLVVRAYMASPAEQAVFSDVALNLLKIAQAGGAPKEIQAIIRKRFEEREIELTQEAADKERKAARNATEDAAHHNACYTMRRRRTSVLTETATPA